MGYCAGEDGYALIITFLLDVEAGGNLQSGYRNVFIGSGAAQSTPTTGHDNVFVGYFAGNEGCGTGQNANVFIGKYAGYYNGFCHNVFIGGAETGKRFGCGKCNIAIGSKAMCGNGTSSTGVNNIVLGYCAGNVMESAEYNILAGLRAGENITASTSNIIIGCRAGENVCWKL